MANKSQFSIIVALSLGEYLKLCIDRKGMTIAAIARKSGISSRTIYRCLADEAALDYQGIVAVCHLVGADLNLIGRSFISTDHLHQLVKEAVPKITLLE
jgi:transcriptional regulator with XRE-family HTH domain